MKKPIFSDNAIKILNERYLLKDKSGNIVETPSEMLLRVAKHVASTEKDKDFWENKFYEMMINLDFLPNTPTLMNAGTNMGQLSACFYLPVEDSMEGIFETLKQTSCIHRGGGGTGFSFNKIRPNGSAVKTTQGKASGAISFMKVFDAATEQIVQGGKRRGANMGVLNINHPEIEDFIKCKDEDGILKNFNISVGITDDFIEAVKNNKQWKLSHPNSDIVKTVNAKELFDKIVYQAWKNGEPGLLFLDEMNRRDNVPFTGEKFAGTNPCGEVCLKEYEACNLGSINLVNFINEDNTFDFERLKETTRIAVRFLDNVIEVNNYPVEQIKEKTLANRKIGLGVMGLADLFYKLEIPYNSEDGINLAIKIIKTIQETGLNESFELGKEKGNFPNFDKSIFQYNKDYMRNATITCIAPTGTISMLADVSGGIEPNFSLAFIKTVMDGKEFKYINKHFEEKLIAEDFTDKEIKDITEKLLNGIKLQDIPNISDEIKKIFVTAQSVDALYHVLMQSAFQEYVDNSVSKTINLPNNATKEQVKDIYLLAHKFKCKGITVYRDGSRANQVLSTKKKENKPAISEYHPREREEITFGQTIKYPTPCGSLFVTINKDSNGICEMFGTMGKSGGCKKSFIEGTCRLASLAFRSGIDIDEIIDQIQGIQCSKPFFNKGNKILSCTHALADAISKFHESTIPIKCDDLNDLCPECNKGKLIRQEGCLICNYCNYSKC